MNSVMVFAAVFLVVVTFTLSALLGALMMRTGIVDRPDGDRKKQTQAIPRLGGVAIFLTLLAGCFVSAGIYFWVGGASLPQAVAATFGFAFAALQNADLFAAMVFVAILIGLWDDIWTANTKLKLIVLSATCIFATGYGLHPEALTSPFGTLNIPTVLVLGSTLWLLVFINAANFMDGANGLAVGCMAIMLAGLAIAGTLSGDFNLSLWWFALFGAIAGFLIHNLRGTLYAGDAGALGLGALFASLGLVSGLEVWTVATLALPFLIDVLLTLVWRAKHKRSWLKAHRDHAYQRLIDTGWSHMDVAFLYWGMSIACAVAAVIAAKSGGAAPFAVFWALTLMGTVLWCFNRSEVRLKSET